MKTTFPKAKPKVIQYRDYKNFVLENFRMELRFRLQIEMNNMLNLKKYSQVFQTNMLLRKKKILRANDKPYMTKALRKCIMRSTALQNKFHWDRSLETE